MMKEREITYLITLWLSLVEIDFNLFTWINTHFGQINASQQKEETYSKGFLFMLEIFLSLSEN